MKLLLFVHVLAEDHDTCTQSKLAEHKRRLDAANQLHKQGLIAEAGCAQRATQRATDKHLTHAGLPERAQGCV